MGGGCGFHPIRDAISSIFGGGCGDSGCCVGVGSGSSRKTKTVDHATKIANELAKMKTDVAKSSKKVEEKIMKYINGSMERFMKEIDKINQQKFYGESLNINTKAIREKNEQLMRRVQGCVSNVMNTRLVSGDKELSVILEEKDDAKRKANFQAFVDRVKKEALEKLKEEIERTVAEQSEVVSSEIHIRQKEIQERLEETIRELTEIAEEKKNSVGLAKRQIEYMYQSSLCDFLLQEVRGEVAGPVDAE